MAKTIIITGASRGIGRAIAEEFAGLDCHLALLSRNFAEVDAAAKEIAAARESHFKLLQLPYQCDVTDKNKVEETFDEIKERTGSIDVLVNNAGVNSRRTLNPQDRCSWFDNLAENLAGWHEEIAVNLTAVYVCSYLAAGYMLEQGTGSIINISSIKGIEPTSSPGYGSSKAGVIKLTKDMAKSLAGFGIRINCITPGFIDTGMTTELPEEKKIKYKGMIPQRRFGTVEEVAKAAAFLASADSSYITGQTLGVNGGYLC